VARPSIFSRLAWLLTFAVTLCVGATAYSRPEAAGQQCTIQNCTNQAVNVTGPTVIPIVHHLGVCRVDNVPVSSLFSDGAFVLPTPNPVIAHGGQASLTGSCNTRGCAGPSGPCQTLFSTPRNIQSIWLSCYKPDGTTCGNVPMSFIGQPPNGQTMDSQIPGTTTGPIAQIINMEGLWRFRDWVVSSSTPCNIQPLTHPEVILNVNAMYCKPEWFTGGGINYHAPPTGDIVIRVPSIMKNAFGPAEQAAASWSTTLNRNVSVVLNDTPCPAGNPLCVGMNDDHGTLPNDPEGCASLGTASYTPTGVWTGTTTVRLSPNWTSGHPQRVQRTIAHELGHYFGLWNRTCFFTDTVMGPWDCDNPAPPPADAPLGPTASDGTAASSSTYGNGVRQICGYPAGKS
jgi:hypothetical protein